MGQKPYFSAADEDCLLGVFKQTMLDQKEPYDDKMMAAVQKYAQSSKHDYENHILRGVIDGKYTFMCKDGQAQWSTIDANESNKKTYEEVKAADQFLARAVTLLAMTANKKSGVIIPK